MTKTFPLLLFLFCLASTALAEVDFGKKVSSTPYDRHMVCVMEVLKKADSQASMKTVRRLMFIGRGYRYLEGKSHVPAAPEITTERKGGDCKDKTLWLAEKLNDTSLRFVIGKARSTSVIGHSWLYWQDKESRWWILDCTNRKLPVLADSVPVDHYIPCYSYTRDGVFRHWGASLASAAKPSPTPRPKPKK